MSQNLLSAAVVIGALRVNIRRSVELVKVFSMIWVEEWELVEIEWAWFSINFFSIAHLSRSC